MSPSLLPSPTKPAHGSFGEQGYTPEDQAFCAAVRGSYKRNGGRLPSPAEYREILAGLGHRID